MHAAGADPSRWNLAKKPKSAHSEKLEDTARYTGLLLAPAEGFGHGLFCPSGKKTHPIILFWSNLGHFWCPVVTLLTF